MKYMEVIGMGATPLIMFLVYHTLNVYTDVRYRITKNLWHLLFFGLGVAYYIKFVSNDTWYHPFLAALIALIIGLFIESFKLSSPGDTKMFSVSAILLLGMAHEHIRFYEAALAIVLFHYLFIAIVSYYILFKRHGIKETFKQQAQDFKALIMPGMPLNKEKIFEHFPGATTILLGGVLYYTAIQLIYG